ncbi:MAG: hypothetical protein ABIJ21_00795 [Nanoarchaeota archaeon]
MAEKKIVQKKKKKKWIPLIAGEPFSGKQIGECPVYETPQLLGRMVTVNYMTLTGDMKKQHINLSFKVTDIKEGQAHAEITRYVIIPSSLRRFVRKGRNKIDDSFVVKTKDDKYVRIKPLLVTNSRTDKSVTTNLRVTTKKILQNVLSTYSFSQLVEEIITYKLQKYLRDILHKTYPLKTCEIRNFRLLDKAPLNFSFASQDIADIIQKSRTAKKGKGEEGKKEEESEDASADDSPLKNSQA